MSKKVLKPLASGLTATMASLLAVSLATTGIANSYRSQIDGALGTSSYKTVQDEENARFKKSYSKVDDFMAAVKDHAIRQGEEGTAIMKNDNAALPLAQGKKIALFGVGAWAPYQASNDLKANNEDCVYLEGAVTEAGYELEPTVTALYKKWVTSKPSSKGGLDYTNGPNTSLGDMVEYKINELPADQLGVKGENADWKNTVVKNDTIAICVFSRPAGENNTYGPGTAVNFAGQATGKDPLALSDDELSIVDVAKQTCSKVVVLINSGNTMEIGEIAKGGAHEVDAIAYIGIPNDYQFTGIMNVLSGKVNATGALPDTYVQSNLSAPAMMNFAGGMFADEDIAAYEDPRWPGATTPNGINASSFGAGAMYSGGAYMVEAEGIYVGYKYYESRYFDAVMGQGNASGAAGATQDTTWKYNKEVVYSFGHTISYLDYTQEITKVDVEKTPEGNITATVKVTNNSTTDGRFLAQLYVQQPYTQYDKTNKVEKSAISYLNAKKVNVKAGKSETVEITIPTKYLASYDYTNAKTYILDEGNYYFTAAAGAHEAVNNILAKEGKTTADGMDANGTGKVVTWTNSAFDKTTYAVENGKKVTNVADNADMNYWLPGTVTYLSRSDWQATYPKNYNATALKIGDSTKKDEWLKEIRGQQYTITETAQPAVEGADQGIKFSAEFIGYEQFTNIDDPYWAKFTASLTIDQAVGGVIHGGSQTDEYTNIDNPIVKQSEGVNGVTGDYVPAEGEEAERAKYKFNVNSQTLLGSSFNEELAWEWGVLEGESGLWLNKFTAWGVGLTLRRTPYNARNYEYISEDPMLTNRMGYGVMGGALEKGFLCGPKHMGFNDQEHYRSGIGVFITEQKMRETDLRGFQGGLEDAHGLAVMIAFNRIGSTNASHHAGMLLGIVRGEWAFKGLISTDMATNHRYFIAESMVMAGITQVADFGQNDNKIQDSTWTYLSVANVSKDATLVEQARTNLKYQFYAFANSAIVNVSTYRVTPWWEASLNAVTIVTAVLTGLAAAGWVATIVVPMIKKEEV